MLKNIVQIIRAVFFCVITVVSYACYATIEYIPVEIKCGKNPMTAPQFIINGEPGTQYILSTNGLRVDGVMEEVIKTGSVGRTRDGMHMYTGARCTSAVDGVDISLTGSVISCGIGEGIKVKMYEPNSRNSDKYHYVGTLTIIREENVIQKEEETLVIDDSPIHHHEKISFPFVGTNDLKITAGCSIVGVSDV